MWREFEFDKYSVKIHGRHEEVRREREILEIGVIGDRGHWR